MAISLRRNHSLVRNTSLFRAVAALQCLAISACGLIEQSDLTASSAVASAVKTTTDGHAGISVDGSLIVPVTATPVTTISNDSVASISALTSAPGSTATASDTSSTADKAIVPVPPVIVTIPDASNVVTIREDLGIARSNYPLQLGRAFAKGKYVGAVQIRFNGTSIPTQTDIKNRWPDGSIRFAVLSAVIPNIAASSKGQVEFESIATPASVQAPSLASFLSSNPGFDASLTATVAGTEITATLRQMLIQGVAQLWTQGPVNSTYIVADHSSQRRFDFGVSSLKSVRPIMQVTIWHALGQARVRFIAENGNSEGLEDASYDVKLSIGSGSNAKTVYTQSAVPHHVGARWTKVAWYGDTPKPLSINHNAAYLSSLRLIPNYDPAAKLTESQIKDQVTRWNGASKALFDPGFWTKSMPSPGGREEIALFPNWTVDALLSGDYRLQEISDTHAELAAAWPMHFREGSSSKFYDTKKTLPGLGSPVSLFGRPGMWYGTQNYYIRGSWIATSDQFTWGSQVSNGGWAPDGSHQPAPFLLPYLTTGEYFWLEEMQFWASWGAFLASIDLNSGFYGRGPTLTSASLSGDIRTQAWVLRNRASAAAFSVDGSKEKTYYESLMMDAITIAEGIRGITGSATQGNASYQWGETVGRTGFYGDLGVHPLHMWDNGSESFAQQYASLFNIPLDRAFAPFQMAYIIIALDHAKGLGYPTDKLLNWAAVFITEATKNPQTAPLLGNFDIPSVQASPRGNMTTWNSLASAFADPTYPTTFVDAWLNSPDGMPLIMTAATATITDLAGGSDSWKWVKANWVDRRTYSVPSRWAVVPRTN